MKFKVGDKVTYLHHFDAKNYPIYWLGTITEVYPDNHFKYKVQFKKCQRLYTEDELEEELS